MFGELHQDLASPLTQWQGAQDTLQPVDLDEAIELFEGPLTEHEVRYAEAFPDVVAEA